MLSSIRDWTSIAERPPRARPSLAVLSLLLLVAIFAPLLANDQPLYLEASFPHDVKVSLRRLGIASMRMEAEWKEGDRAGMEDERRQLDIHLSRLKTNLHPDDLEPLDDFERELSAFTTPSEETLARVRASANQVRDAYEKKNYRLKTRVLWPAIQRLSRADVALMAMAIGVLFLLGPLRWLNIRTRYRFLVAAILSTILYALTSGVLDHTDNPPDYRWMAQQERMEIERSIDAPIPHGVQETRLEERLHAPTSRHWMGTDESGRDVTAQVLWGARLSMLVGAVATSILLVLGVLAGTIAGYARGALDLILSRLIEIVQSVPALLIVMALLAFMDRSAWTVAITIGLLGWPSLARLVRGEILRAARADYVMASKALGCRTSRIIVRHLLPATLPPVFVACAFGAAASILLESSLSFLGLGVDVHEASWGSILEEFRRTPSAWWLSLFPGILIFVTVWSLNQLGEHYRAITDPRESRRGPIR